MFVSSMYRSLITIQYPRCIECVSKWYRKTIQYRSPDGAKNVSCLYRKCIEQKVSRYCIEREISKITIHIRYTSIQFDTVRYIYRENAPRYIGKKALFPLFSVMGAQELEQEECKLHGRPREPGREAPEARHRRGFRTKKVRYTWQPKWRARQPKSPLSER